MEVFGEVVDNGAFVVVGEGSVDDVGVDFVDISLVYWRVVLGTLKLDVRYALGAGGKAGGYLL